MTDMNITEGEFGKYMFDTNVQSISKGYFGVYYGLIQPGKISKILFFDNSSETIAFSFLNLSSPSNAALSNCCK